MWAAQFRPISPVFDDRDLLHTPPHPLQPLPMDENLEPAVQNITSVRAAIGPPDAPPPSPITTFSSIDESLDLEDAESMDGIDSRETTRWNQLLFYFSQGRAAGRRAWDYIPFTAIAPSYLPLSVRTPAWILEQVRGDVSSELIRLRPGSAICVQDISRQNTFYNPAAPTMLGTIDRMLWREDGYQVASVCTHVYSPRGYDFEDEYISFIAIPIYFIDTALLLTQSPYNSLGQTILNDMVVPPYRVWEPAGYALRRFELGEILIEDRSEAIRNWVDEQARFGWF